MTTTRAPEVDEHGVEHRPGCPRPGWSVEQSRTIRGVSICRCYGCGAILFRREGDR